MTAEMTAEMRRVPEDEEPRAGTDSLSLGARAGSLGMASFELGIEG